ncbi:hypothetical protein FE782_24680 [Paenibacillus antri]|uniref:Uncharacterized protein n=2 Tax=Paenibacillus antri TaxID=2582848 RepID=A0A5R9FZU2_9BACL|nr:hypothetical protein FE782_24680 [Paenibacillus antri]
MLTAFAASPTPASALSCARVIPLEEEFARAAAVFRGEVDERRDDGTVALRVDAVWKGADVGPSVVVQPNMWVDFREDGEYVVFAERHDDAWSPILCGNSGTESAFARHALGEPIETFPPPPAQPPEPALTGKTAAFAAAVLVVVAYVSFAAGARWSRRRR